MKTDVITISNNGDQMDVALQQAEKTAVYKGLSHKDALHLRLLAEEMLGMMSSITGTEKGKFWIEDDGEEFQLHLKVRTRMDYEQRQQLLAASTSGENEAAKGFMGKIRTFFDPLDDVAYFPNTSYESMGLNMTWSMTAYMNLVQTGMEQNEQGATEAWDELEKSVVTHIADEVKVSMQGRDVEMIIYKKM